MKLYLKALSLMVILSGILLSTDASAQQPRKKRAVKRAVVANRAVKRRAVTRERSRRYLRRTNLAVLSAQRHVKRGKNYTGDFSKSVRNQRYARRLFRRGMYRKAVFYSRRSRLLAYTAIRANKGKVGNDIADEAGDEELYDGIPADTELDIELNKEMGASTASDQDLLNSDLGDIKLNEEDMKPMPGK